MKTFKVTQKLKQAAYAYIVTHLMTKKERKPLAKLFSELDMEHNGHLTKTELAKAYEMYFGSPIDCEQIETMFNRIDMSGSGKIEFSEFLMSCSSDMAMLTMDNLASVFRYFDDNGNGSISEDEIKTVFE